MDEDGYYLQGSLRSHNKRLDRHWQEMESIVRSRDTPSHEEEGEDEWEKVKRIMEQMGMQNGEEAQNVSSIEAESAVLVERLVFQMLENLPKTDQYRQQAYISLNRIQLNHLCSGGCRFAHVPVNEAYQYNGKSYRATGEVFVCQVSGRPHLCGEHCNVKVLVRNADDCMTCPYTGFVLTELKQYTLANSRLEKDVRVVGNLLYEPNPWTEDSLAEKDKRNLRERLMEVTDNTVDLNRTCELFGERFGEISFEVIKGYLVGRVKNRETASEVYDTEVLSEAHEKKQNRVIMGAHRNFIYHVDEYLSKCVEEGRQGDFLVLLKLFMQLEYPVYKGIHYGADPSTVKKRLKSQVIDMILYMWDKVCVLDSVTRHSVQFRAYALGMLTIMSGSADDYPEGMVVYLKIDDNGKPFRVGEERLEQVDLSKFSVVRVEFIPRIASLVLAKGTIVQQQKKSQARKRTWKAAFPKSQNLLGGEVNSACRRGSKANKAPARDRTNGRMPALKIMPFIYNDIINAASSISDIDEYCARTILADTEVTIHLQEE